jgi:hypothetical protein
MVDVKFVITGSSFTLVTLTVISWVIELVPSLAVTFAVYEVLVS